MNSNSPLEPIVVCKNIYKFYGEGATRVEALRGVDLTINRGELRLLMGPSGSGKTTLISIIAAILTQDEGECLINNIDLNHLPDQEKTRYRGKNLGFVFQLFNLVKTITVEENIAIPRLLQNVKRKEALQRAKNLMEELDMGDKVGTSPADLSGGQQQRVAIARALIHEPQIIICDEPTSFLDHITGHKIMELLQKLVRTKKITVIVVTHDPRIEKYADNIDFLEDGKIIPAPTS
jgi:putative ABC transport system ATP-binding protein